MNASSFEFLFGETPRFPDQPLNVTLRGSENAFVPFENGKTGVQSLGNVAQVGGRRGNPSVRRWRGSRDNAQGRNSKLTKDVFETQSQVRLGVGDSALPDTENGEGIADPLGEALLIECSHTPCDTQN